MSKILEEEKGRGNPFLTVCRGKRKKKEYALHIQFRKNKGGK